MSRRKVAYAVAACRFCHKGILSTEIKAQVLTCAGPMHGPCYQEHYRRVQFWAAGVPYLTPDPKVVGVGARLEPPKEEESCLL